MKTAEDVSMEARQCTVSARVENVDDVVMFGDGNREGAASGRLVNEDGETIQQMKAGNSSASCIDGEQERAILAEGECALRLQRVGGAAAAAAAGGNTLGEGEAAIGETPVGQHRIFIGIVCHDENG